MHNLQQCIIIINSAVLSKFGLSDTTHQQDRQNRTNRSQISQAQACQIQREKTYPEAAFKVLVTVYHNFFFRYQSS